VAVVLSDLKMLRIDGHQLAMQLSPIRITRAWSS
jgi:hypothetical protein